MFALCTWYMADVMFHSSFGCCFPGLKITVNDFDSILRFSCVSISSFVSVITRWVIFPRLFSTDPMISTGFRRLQPDTSRYCRVAQLLISHSTAASSTLGQSATVSHISRFCLIQSCQKTEESRKLHLLRSIFSIEWHLMQISDRMWGTRLTPPR